MRFQLPAKLTKAGMLGESCCGRSIPSPRLFHPLPTFCSLLIPKHPLIPQSGGCTKPDPAVGAGDGQIIQSLNLFHLFLWLRIVREQMAIFSSVSVIRSHSLRQRWLKQIPGPLQSHHLVFPSAQPLPSAWAGGKRGGRRAGAWGQPHRLSLSSPRSAELQRLSGAAGIRSPAWPACGAAQAGSPFPCHRQGEADSPGERPVANWKAACCEKTPVAVSAVPPCPVWGEMGGFRVAEH